MSPVPTYSCVACGKLLNRPVHDNEGGPIEIWEADSIYLSPSQV